MTGRVYVDGVGYVQKGSYSTKNDHGRWRWCFDKFSDRGVNSFDTLFLRATALIVNGLDPMADSDSLSLEAYMRRVREDLDGYLAVVDIQRKLKLLENTEGRTAEEAVTYRAKAAEMREKLAGWLL
jgi:hypothetical protein